MTLIPRQRRPFTAAEFWKMYELGFFSGQRVELIGGEIVAMAAQSNLHAIGLDLTRNALAAAFGPGFWVRVQNSLDLSPLSVPDPDIAVVAGTPHQFRGQRANPAAAAVLLIVEVSETTLWEDRGRKASLYAAAGIADYWILNIPDNTLEIRRDPRPDATQDFGYATLATLTAADFAAPLAMPAARISVADLLPN